MSHTLLILHFDCFQKLLKVSPKTWISVSINVDFSSFYEVDGLSAWYLKQFFVRSIEFFREFFGNFVLHFLRPVADEKYAWFYDFERVFLVDFSNKTNTYKFWAHRLVSSKAPFHLVAVNHLLRFDCRWWRLEPLSQVTDPDHSISRPWTKKTNLFLRFLIVFSSMIVCGRSH